MTIAQLSQLGAVSPRLALIAQQILSNGAEYDRFVDVLYQVLDACIRTVEEDPKARKDDGEDRLSWEIIAMLRAAGYDANHDATIGGHSDIVVKSLRGDCWVGEAKIHGAYDYLEKGWNQLTTRYLRGTPGYDKGALLIYIRNQDCTAVVSRWKKHVQNLKLANFATSDCASRKELGFYSVHTHKDSGRTVHIRHIGVQLCWDPA